MNSLRDLFISLGLSIEGASFAEGLAWEQALERGAHMVVAAVEKMGEFFVGAIEKTADFGESMDLLAEKTGVGVEEIQKLSYAAGLSGATADGLRTSLVHLARTVEEAKAGGEQAVKAFTSLGISMKDVKKDAPDQLLLKMADRMKELGPGTKRTAAAMDLLGRSGTDLLPMLAEGSDAIKTLGDEAQRSGVIMSGPAAKAARDFGDNVKRLQNDWEGITRELAGPLIEALDPVVKAIHAWVIQNRALISVKVKEFATGIVKAASAVVTGLEKMGEVIGWVIDNWKLFAFVIAGVVLAALQMNAIAIATNIAWYIALGVAAVTSAAAAAAAWLAAAAPFVLLAAVITLAALAAEDLYYFLTGGDSVLGELVDDWRGFLDSFITAPANNWFTRWLQEQLIMVRGLVALWDSFMASVEHVDQLVNGGIGKALGAFVMGPQQQRSLGADAADSMAASPGGGHGSQGGGGVYAPITINQKEGQDAGDVADEVSEKIEHRLGAAARSIQRKGGIQ